MTAVGRHQDRPMRPSRDSRGGRRQASRDSDRDSDSKTEEGRRNVFRLHVQGGLAAAWMDRPAALSKGTLDPCQRQQWSGLVRKQDATGKPSSMLCRPVSVGQPFRVSLKLGIMDGQGSALWRTAASGQDQDNDHQKKNPVHGAPWHRFSPDASELQSVPTDQLLHSYFRKLHLSAEGICLPVDFILNLTVSRWSPVKASEVDKSVIFLVSAGIGLKDQLMMPFLRHLGFYPCQTLNHLIDRPIIQRLQIQRYSD